MSLALDHNPADVVFFDIETQSGCDLKACGGRNYAEHESTRVLSLVCLIDGHFHVWIPLGVLGRVPVHPPTPDFLWPNDFGIDVQPLTVHMTPGLPEPIAAAVLAGRVFVAHNCADFDMHVWRQKITPVPTRWFDTMPTARAAGYPAKLDSLSKVFFGRGKDAGSKVMKQIMTAEFKHGQWCYQAQPLRVYAVARYNVADVITLARLYYAVADYGESDVIDAHFKVNDRGIGFDTELAGLICRHSNTAISRAVHDVEEMTLGAINANNLKSGKQIHAWLNAKGVRLWATKNGQTRPCLDRKTVERFIEKPESFGDEGETGAQSIDPVVFSVLKLRQAALRITSAKLEKAQHAISRDRRIRDLFVYHGAHTGRWTSHKVQVHNLTKGLRGIDVEALLKEYAAGRLDYAALERVVAKLNEKKKVATTDDVLSALIRPTFVPARGRVFLIIDFAGIEARGVAWSAREQSLLNLFLADADVYVDMAGTVYGRELTAEHKTERDIGKILILGCGYGMSDTKFALFCAGQGVDLSVAGVTAKQCVDAYRDKFPNIAGVAYKRQEGRAYRRGGLWAEAHAATFQAVATDDSAIAGRCHFAMKDGNLICTLPSGRELTYRRARIEQVVPGYCAMLGLPEVPKPTVVYDSPKGFDNYLFGGKVVENFVQAFCRDLLATALVRLERMGMEPVIHVHDELVCEVNAEHAHSALKVMAEVMSAQPSWAEGFPIKIEGFAAPRYVKSAMIGWPTVTALNGRIQEFKIKTAKK